MRAGRDESIVLDPHGIIAVLWRTGKVKKAPIVGPVQVAVAHEQAVCDEQFGIGARFKLDEAVRANRIDNNAVKNDSRRRGRFYVEDTSPYGIVGVGVDDENIPDSEVTHDVEHMFQHCRIRLGGRLDRRRHLARRRGRAYDLEMEAVILDDAVEQVPSAGFQAIDDVTLISSHRTIEGADAGGNIEIGLCE